MSKNVFLFLFLFFLQVADGATGQMCARQRFKKSHFKEEKLVNEICYWDTEKKEWKLEIMKLIKGKDNGRKGG